MKAHLPWRETETKPSMPWVSLCEQPVLCLGAHFPNVRSKSSHFRGITNPWRCMQIFQFCLCPPLPLKSTAQNLLLLIHPKAGSVSHGHVLTSRTFAVTFTWRCTDVFQIWFVSKDDINRCFDWIFQLLFCCFDIGPTPKDHLYATKKSNQLGETF